LTWFAFFWFSHRAASSDLSDEDTPAENTPDLRLDEGERKYLWQVEHHGQVLGRYGFKPLANALTRADPKAVLRLLAADFSGRILENPQEVKLVKPFAQVVRSQQPDSLPKNNGSFSELTREEFVRRLCAFRQAFTDPPKVQVSLMTLSPVERKQLDGPWQGKAFLRMWGESLPGQPCEVALMLDYRIPRPTRRRLQAGGWLRSGGITQSLEARAPRYLFRESAEERGLNVGALHDNWNRNPLLPQTGGVYLCDYNRDGRVDMLVVDVNGYFLYQGLPEGKFKDVTRQVNLPRRIKANGPQSTLTGFIDIDGDGWEDLILGGRIYRNEKGKTFEDYTSRCTLSTLKDVVGFAFADYDRDGLVDVYAYRSGQPEKDSWLDGKTGKLEGNLLLRNKGDWQFEDVTRVSGTGGGARSTFAAVWFDANNDGWPDLYVPNEFGDGVLLVNQRDGTFREHKLTEGACDYGTMGAACGDIDNDGHIDIYAANMYSKAGMRVIGNLAPDAYPEEVMAKIRRFVTGSQLHRNRGGLRFEQLGQKCQVASVGWAYGAALVDLDNDGWLDLYATAGFISKDRKKPDG
jgi:hypothetical protein